ncbi:response to biotic stimulus [Mactra antiquata]
MDGKGGYAPPSYDQANQGQQGFGQYPPQGQYGMAPPPGQYAPPAGQYAPPAGQYAPAPQFGGHMQQSNVVVTQVGGYGPGATYQAPPHDYTTQAWIACLCCFWPTGILAIMRASESRNALACGDMARAHEAANSARTMVRISYLAGVLSIVVAVVIVGVYVGVIMNSINNYDY